MLPGSGRTGDRSGRPGRGWIRTKIIDARTCFDRSRPEPILRSQERYLFVHCLSHVTLVAGGKLSLLVRREESVNGHPDSSLQLLPAPGCDPSHSSLRKRNHALGLVAAALSLHWRL